MSSAEEIRELTDFAEKFLPDSAARVLVDWPVAWQQFALKRMKSYVTALEERNVALDPVSFEAVMEVAAVQAIATAQIIDRASNGGFRNDS